MAATQICRRTWVGASPVSSGWVRVWSSMRTPVACSCRQYPGSCRQAALVKNAVNGRWRCCSNASSQRLRTYPSSTPKNTTGWDVPTRLSVTANLVAGTATGTTTGARRVVGGSCAVGVPSASGPAGTAPSPSPTAGPGPPP